MEDGNDDDKKQLLFHALKQYAFARKNNFLNVNLANDLLTEAKKLENNGKLKDAGMNKGTYLYQVKPNQRGDKMLWVTSLSDKEVADCFKSYLKEMKKLRKQLNSNLPNLCLDGKISIQLAYYPGGGSRYVRHIDAFKPTKDQQASSSSATANGQTRKITAIVYLNPDWKEEDYGGDLRAYITKGIDLSNISSSSFQKDEKNNEYYIDTSPIFNRMLIFYSDEIEHEVLPCNSNRFALTCWFYTKNENYYQTNEKIPTMIKETNHVLIGKRFPKLLTTKMMDNNVNNNNDNNNNNNNNNIEKEEELIQTSGFMMLRPGDLKDEKIALTYDIPSLPLLVDDKMVDNRKKTIFVSIPSYRDPECQYTIQNLFQTATFPDRIFIGVCMQYDRIADENCFVLPPQRPNQVRMMHIDHRDAKGPSYARFMVEKLYNNEDYILQIDSHMRLRPNWDTFLIEKLNQCPSSKPIITAYPLGYTLPNNIPLNESTRGTLLCASHFDKDNVLRIKGKRFRAKDNIDENEIVPSLFWASGFSFTNSKVYEEVPYDPLPHLFFGEESIMCARLWTSGYDFFATKEAVAYHLWSRSNRPVFQQHTNEEKEKQKAQSRKIVMDLLCNNNNNTSYKYNLGNVRTLNEFQDHIGVSFNDLMIKDFAKYGGQSKIIFNDDIANGNTNNTNVTTAKKDTNLDSLINNVMLLMKKRGDVV